MTRGLLFCFVCLLGIFGRPVKSGTAEFQYVSVMWPKGIDAAWQTWRRSTNVEDWRTFGKEK